MKPEVASAWRVASDWPGRGENPKNWLEHFQNLAGALLCLAQVGLKVNSGTERGVPTGVYRTMRPCEYLKRFDHGR
jgi:hypothetical protein